MTSPVTQPLSAMIDDANRGRVVSPLWWLQNQYQFPSIRGVPLNFFYPRHFYTYMVLGCCFPNPLYVGRSVTPGKRIRQHEDAAPWWSISGVVLVTKWDSFDGMKTAEMAWINAVNPLFNIQRQPEVMPRLSPQVDVWRTDAHPCRCALYRLGDTHPLSDNSPSNLVALDLV